MMLSKLKHENIIPLLHFCIDGDERILVYEYASRGSLDRYLSDASLTWIQRLRICIEAARAINYLHDPKGSQQRFLHRDIKSSNILLDENWTVKVSDFGLSKIGLANQPQTYVVSNAVGTIGYVDPLCNETGLLSKESDVYSFGVVLFEAMCGKLCYDKLKGVFVRDWKESFVEKKLDDIIFDALKGQIDKDCLMRFSSIAYRCLDADHRKRPVMVNIIQELESAFAQQLNSRRISNHIPWMVKSMKRNNGFHSSDPVKLQCLSKSDDVDSGVKGLIQLMQPESAENKTCKDIESALALRVDDSSSRTLKPPRFLWTVELHMRFVDVVKHLGVNNAIPKTIIQMMNVDGLTLENVESHLEKYRRYLKHMQGLSTKGSSSSGSPVCFDSCSPAFTDFPMPMPHRAGAGSGAYDYRCIGP